MSNETPEAKKAELIRFRLEELKHLIEEVGHNTNNKLMKDVRNQLAHCSISYSPYGTVFMEETSAMRQLPHDWHPLFDRKIFEDENGHEKVYVDVRGKRKVLYHIYSLEQREQLYHRFRVELSQAGELVPLPRTVLGCPQCGDFPASPFGSGQIVCPHVRDGIEKAYRRDEFGDIIGYLAFKHSPNNTE